MPTSATHTYNNQKLEPFQNPEEAKIIEVTFAAGAANIPKGTLLGEVTASPGVYKAYNDANNDGSQTAKAIAQYDMQIDANGLITLSSVGSTAGGESGEKLRAAPAYVSGTFKTTDLTGLDAAAVTDLGRLIQGTVADGILRVG
jgi:hypothetical protein